MKQLVVFGDRTANEVFEAAELAESLSRQGQGGSQFDRLHKVYYTKETFLELAEECRKKNVTAFYHIGIANVELKKEIADIAAQAKWTPHSIIHPSAIIASSASIGKGVYVGPLAVISSNALVEDHSIVHIHASIGHDTQVSRMCAVLPGARLSGNVKIGDRSLIGSNAFVAAGTQIGEDCQVDALTYVGRDLESGYLASVRTTKPVRRVGFAKSD